MVDFTSAKPQIDFLDSLHNAGIKPLNPQKIAISQDFARYSEEIHNDTTTADKPIFLDELQQDSPQTQYAQQSLNLRNQGIRYDDYAENAEMFLEDQRIEPNHQFDLIGMRNRAMERAPYYAQNTLQDGVIGESDYRARSWLDVLIPRLQLEFLQEVNAYNTCNNPDVENVKQMEISGITPYTGCQLIDKEEPYSECVQYEDLYKDNLYYLPKFSNSRMISTLKNKCGIKNVEEPKYKTDRCHTLDIFNEKTKENIQRGKQPDSILDSIFQNPTENFQQNNDYTPLPKTQPFQYAQYVAQNDQIPQFEKLYETKNINNKFVNKNDYTICDVDQLPSKQEYIQGNDVAKFPRVQESTPFNHLKNYQQYQFDNYLPGEQMQNHNYRCNPKYQNCGFSLPVDTFENVYSQKVQQYEHTTPSIFTPIQGVNTIGKNRLRDIEMAIKDPTIMDERVRQLHNYNPCPNTVLKNQLINDGLDYDRTWVNNFNRARQISTNMVEKQFGHGYDVPIYSCGSDFINNKIVGQMPAIKNQSALQGF